MERKTKKKIEGKITRSKNIATIAKRFAAKEAISKAIGYGFSKGIHFKNIEIYNDKNGKPYANVNGKAKTTLSKISKKYNINVWIHNADKITYDSLKNVLTKNKDANYKTPLSSYEYSGKTYYNLKVKEKNVPNKLEKNKSKSMIIEVLFFNYDYLGKQGARVIVQDYKVVEDQMPKFECVSLDDIMD